MDTTTEDPLTPRHLQLAVRSDKEVTNEPLRSAISFRKLRQPTLDSYAILFSVQQATFRSDYLKSDMLNMGRSLLSKESSTWPVESQAESKTKASKGEKSEKATGGVESVSQEV